MSMEVLVGSREWRCVLRKPVERVVRGRGGERSSHSSSLVRNNPFFSLRFVVI